MNTSSITQKEELAALCVMDYFTALFEISMDFTVTGEELLAYSGYCDLDWAKSLFTAMKPATRLLSSDYFTDEQKSKLKILKALACASEEEIAALLSREIVAIFCAADNILTALYCEYVLHWQGAALQKRATLTKDERAQLRQIRCVLPKFRKVKEAYIEITTDGGPDMAYRMGLEAEFVGSKTPIHDALLAAATVYQYCPRNLTADQIRLTKLCRKHGDSIAYCKVELNLSANIEA